MQGPFLAIGGASLGLAVGSLFGQLPLCKAGGETGVGLAIGFVHLEAQRLTGGVAFHYAHIVRHIPAT